MDGETAWRAISFGLSPEQAAVIRRVSEVYNVSIGSMLDDCLDPFLRARFQIAWPPADRGKQGRRLQEARSPVQGGSVTPYVVMLNEEQHAAKDRVLALLGNQWGALSALIEEAFAGHLAEVYPDAVESWPSGDRHRCVDELLTGT